MRLELVLVAGIAATLSNGQEPCKPLAIPNAVYVPAIAGFSSVEAGGRVRVSCRPGFANPGATWLVCNGGVWDTAEWDSPKAPECLAQCPPLNISNAIYNPPSAGTGLTGHNAQVEISCKPGFEFVGDSPVTCYFGEFLNVGGAGCFQANESFCRDSALLPLIQGLSEQYSDDPMRLNEVINYYVLNFRGVRENGLQFLGLDPNPAVKDWSKLAYYVSGITGSDAVYRAVTIPAAWNLTSLPAHFQMKNSYCRLWNEEAQTTTYVFKILYKEGFGQYEYR